MDIRWTIMLVAGTSILLLVVLALRGLTAVLGRWIYGEPSIPGNDSSPTKNTADTAPLPDEARLLVGGLSRKVQALEGRASRDPLTNLYNKGYFLDRLGEVLVSEKDRHGFVGLIFADIDNFKKLNDTYGHPFGDTVLKQVAAVVRETGEKAGQPDICRYGGEEITWILSGQAPDQVERLAEQIRQGIARLKFSEEPAVQVTASIGVYSVHFTADRRRHDLTLKEMVELADKQLYQAKKTGKNRVCAQRLA